MRTGCIVSAIFNRPAQNTKSFLFEGTSYRSSVENRSHLHTQPACDSKVSKSHSHFDETKLIGRIPKKFCRGSFKETKYPRFQVASATGTKRQTCGDGERPHCRDPTGSRDPPSRRPATHRPQGACSGRRPGCRRKR